LGYVGAVSLACLARDGHDVVGVDIDPAKLGLIREGRTPIVEEGMVDLVRAVVASGRVSVTSNAAEAVLRTDLSLICVGTPSAADGSQDQSAMLRLAKDLGTAIRRKPGQHVFVFRSTLVPGTVENVLTPIIEHESDKKDGMDFHACFQPEFLREGSSIEDYEHPPFTIVGAHADPPVAALRALFGHLPCEFLRTSIRTAEMVKYCCNNFHALKIAFANEAARLCEALQVDPFEVLDLLCADRQLNISPVYLKPGFAFGGSCLPKDLRATNYLAKVRGVDLPLHGSVMASNRAHIDHAIDKVMATGKRRIGMIGLSFKTGTDDLRESPLVLLAEHFIGEGLSVLVYDPQVHLSRILGANRRFIEQHVPHIAQVMRRDIEDVIVESEVLIVGLRGRPVFDSLRRHVRSDQVLLDLVNVRDRGALPGQYVGLCW
jgi:GDP-mannose 6-dehydrogenase